MTTDLHSATRHGLRDDLRAVWGTDDADPKQPQHHSESVSACAGNCGRRVNGIFCDYCRLNILREDV